VLLRLTCDLPAVACFVLLIKEAQFRLRDREVGGTHGWEKESVPEREN